MQPDVRDTDLYREITDLYRRLNEPLGEVSAAADLSPAPDGSRVAFTGSRRDSVEADPVSRVCVVDLATGDLEEVTAGPGADRLPRWSPDGTAIAFVSDRRHRGRFGLFLLEAGRLGEAWAAPDVDGSVEWLSWAPDGSAILLGVAGTAAEKAGMEGSGRLGGDDDRPDWLPHVTANDRAGEWRRLWRYDTAARTVAPISPEGRNVWEAAWYGTGAVAAVVSDSPGEEAWYHASLVRIDVATGAETLVHTPTGRRQVGWPAATADGSRLAFVEARASDRWLVAGDVHLVADGATTRVDTGGVDVTHLAWRDDTTLAYVGERDLDTVVGEVDVTTGARTERWAALDAAGTPAALPDGTYVAELHAWDRAPRLSVIGTGGERVVRTLGGGVDPASLGSEETVTWTAPDGLEIQGLLYTPAAGTAPYATVLSVHGGPVAREETRAPARQRLVTALLSRGYAVLVPNVRGSSGRGQAYADLVFGDMGGAEVDDHLAGLDALVARGVVDPARIGVVGGSHGGFMASWLVTRAPERFAASVALSPVTDWRSQHYTTNIADFDTLFVGPLGDPIREERSPIVHVAKVRTPTFLTAGTDDRCTPPGQATEFHQALLEHGVPTACAIYPGEGHGVRRYPAVLDWVTRIAGWFEQWMPARGPAAG